MTRRHYQTYLWPVGILLWSFAACLVTFVFPDIALRPVVVLSFLFICPGMALSRLLRLENALLELLLGIAISITLDSIVACVLLYTGQWSPALILEVLLVLSLAGATGQVLMGWMLAQRMPMFSSDTPVPTDMRVQLALYNTLVLPNTPIPGDIVSRDTLLTERVVPHHTTFASIAEKDTIETSHVVRKKSLFRSVLEINTSKTRRTQMEMSYAQQYIPSIEAIDTQHMPRNGMQGRSIPEIDTVVSPAVPNRNIAFSNTPDAESTELQHPQHHKAIALGMKKVEMLETQPSSLRKTTLRNVPN